jgi:hypothetical protein
MMIEREYYSIEEAANLANCTVDDLMYLGAAGKLQIYFLPAGLQLVTEKYADDQLIERNIDGAVTEPLKLSRRSIEQLEAGNKEAIITLDSERDLTRKVRRHVPTHKFDQFDFSSLFIDPAASAKRATENYRDVKISEVKLIIKREELVIKETKGIQKKSSGRSKNQTNDYERRRESFDDWIKDTGIDISALRTVEDIFNQIKAGCKKEDKALWEIEFSSFKRDFWGRYKKESNIPDRRRGVRPKLRKL